MVLLYTFLVVVYLDENNKIILMKVINPIFYVVSIFGAHFILFHYGINFGVLKL